MATEKKISAAEARRLYAREWRRTHKENVKESNRRYWEKKAAALNEQRENEVSTDEQ